MRWINLLVLCILTAAGCTTTVVDSIDLSKTRLLVVALGSNPENRVRFEEALERKLDAGGIATIASHSLLPHLDRATRADVVRSARDNAVTSVVVIAAMSVDAAHGLEPLGPVSAGAAGPLTAFVDAAIARGQIREDHVVFVTRVYRLATEELVWGGVSWAVTLEGLDAVIDETTTVIAENILTAHRQLTRLEERGIDPTEE